MVAGLLAACGVWPTPVPTGAPPTPVPTLPPPAPTATEPPPTAVPTESPTVSAAGSEEIVGVLWQWLRSSYNNDTELVVDDPSRYTVEFKDDGTLGIQADCNQLRWTYTQERNSLTIHALGPTTLAVCPAGSLDQEFLQDLSEVVAYVVHEGNLVLNIKTDVGSMIFGR
jgi:heat shock protein HslJ